MPNRRIDENWRRDYRLPAYTNDHGKARMTPEEIVLKCLDPDTPTKEWALRAVLAGHGIDANDTTIALADLYEREEILFVPYEGWRLP